MTTFYPFSPSNVEAPSFQASLDGQTYNMVVKWNLFGQDYYLYCSDQDGNLIFTVPVTTSTRAQLLSTITWSAATLRVTATCSSPHRLRIGTVVELTIDNCNPVGYNGSYKVSVDSPYSFSYPLPTNPGEISSIGTYSYIVNMAKGYFASTIVYRNDQFEVSP